MVLPVPLDRWSDFTKVNPPTGESLVLSVVLRCQQRHPYARQMTDVEDKPSVSQDHEHEMGQSSVVLGPYLLFVQSATAGGSERRFT